MPLKEWGNTTPYAMLYGIMIKSKHPQLNVWVHGASFMALTATWHVTRSFQRTTPSVSTQIDVPYITGISISNELLNRTLSGGLTGLSIAIGRHHGYIQFGLIGACVGALTTFISQHKAYFVMTMPLESAWHHLLWLNPVDVVDSREVKAQYTSELQIIQERKQVLKDQIESLESDLSQ